MFYLLTCLRKSPFAGLLVERAGFGRVLGHAAAVVIQNAKIETPLHVAPCAGLLEERGRLGVVLGYAGAEPV